MIKRIALGALVASVAMAAVAHGGGKPPPPAKSKASIIDPTAFNAKVEVKSKRKQCLDPDRLSATQFDPSGIMLPSGETKKRKKLKFKIRKSKKRKRKRISTLDYELAPSDSPQVRFNLAKTKRCKPAKTKKEQVAQCRFTLQNREVDPNPQAPNGASHVTVGLSCIGQAGVVLKLDDVADVDILAAAPIFSHEDRSTYRCTVTETDFGSGRADCARAPNPAKPAAETIAQLTFMQKMTGQPILLKAFDKKGKTFAEFDGEIPAPLG